MRHPTKHGTVMPDYAGYQVVHCDDGEVMYLSYGINSARGATPGDRVELNYIATRSLGLWYGTVEPPKEGV